MLNFLVGTYDGNLKCQLEPHIQVVLEYRHSGMLTSRWSSRAIWRPWGP